MKVLIIGSGGREHALAWKIAQSPHLEHAYIAPGNAGTAQVGENVPLPIDGRDGFRELVDFARQKAIDLVIVGPEAPLAAGVVDALQAAGILVFGPSRLASQIEASKTFAKDFMTRHGIPTAAYATFGNYSSAARYLNSVQYPVVLKADGLAAGKGVLLPENRDEAQMGLRALMVEGILGEAARQMIVEERLQGEEVSLLAFSDGRSLRLMPPAQDHKRLLDGDRGPNTGGMGAYAPAPACPPALAQEIAATVLQPAVDGLRAEGRPFVGVLYAGMILTASGPSVLEFNCRFGDPETQVILPLLETDLLEILSACTGGELEKVEVRWKTRSAACVVLASQGYPEAYPNGLPIQGLDRSLTDTTIFHAGTRPALGGALTAGGRVLGATGWGKNLECALERAYAAAAQVAFEGAHYRRDIGRKGLQPQPAYAAAGVSIDAGNRAVSLMSAAVRSTYDERVLAGLGAFGGLFDAGAIKEMHAPVLVASTDGVGTKLKLAAQAGRYATIGEDIVNHCIDDILVQGARPLFFLDYIAAGKLQPEVVAEVISGMAAACREAGCVLLGGETAEMPGVYAAGELDVAGTIVGAVEKAAILPRGDLQAGDLLVGLASSGAHTNGYSLIRKVFAGVSLETRLPELGQSLGEALLAPHRSYLPVLEPALQSGRIKALAHITGGGLVENLPRILPDGLGGLIRRESWKVPPLFHLIQQRGQVSEAEMYRVFNMGIGMLAVVASQDLPAVQDAIPEEIYCIGELVPGDRKVTLL